VCFPSNKCCIKRPLKINNLLAQSFFKTPVSRDTLRKHLICCNSYYIMSINIHYNTVQCTTVYTVQCTVYSVHCTVYTVHCIMYSVHCTVYNQENSVQPGEQLIFDTCMLMANDDYNPLFVCHTQSSRFIHIDVMSPNHVQHAPPHWIMWLTTTTFYRHSLYDN